MTTINHSIVLKRNPVGMPVPSDFEMVTAPLAAIGDGEMLLKTRWLTLDPYMRSGFMNVPANLGQPIIGGTVSEVIQSRTPEWHPGDLVVGYYGWQTFSIGRPHDVQWNNPGMPIQKWDETLGPASTALGILGMTGYTAFEGLLNVAGVKAGETVVVSAASGAVGQVVGQLAKIRGARAVGIAGGPPKCAFCTTELGFDACVDYKADNFREALAAATPSGIDIYFENVGGDVLEAVIPRLNSGARIPVCGFVSHYNLRPDQARATPLQRLRAEGHKVLGKDGSREGFAFFGFSRLSASHPEAEEALALLSTWIKEGKLKYRESVSDGLESAVPSFIGMLQGQNLGKTMIRVS
jgi:NADPH-dependent curcumin reductase